MLKKVLLNIPVIITLLITMITTGVIIGLGLLTNKYLILVIIFELFVNILAAVLYNLKNKILKIIGIVLLVIIISGNIFTYYYMSKTNSYLEKNFSQETYKVKTRYYLIAKNDNAKELSDINKDERILYYKYSQAVDKAKVEFKDYNLIESNTAYSSLIEVRNNNVYFLLSKVDYDYHIDSTTDLNRDSFRIVYEFDVVEEKNINKEVKDSYNIYISGLDYSGARRDFNMIATVNTKTHKVVLTSIPRDYYLYVPAYDMKDSLTGLGSVDSQVAKESLEKLFNIKIDYTLNLYTESLVKVVDTLGGVEFCSDTEYYTTHDKTIGSYDDKGEKVHVRKGCNTYNGLEILAISRERVRLANSDRGRITNDRQIVINIIKKLGNIDTLKNYNQILNSFDGLYSSNINKRIITELIKKAIENPKFEIIEQSVEGTDTMNYTGHGQYYMWAIEPNMDSINNAANKINEVINEK